MYSCSCVKLCQMKKLRTPSQILWNTERCRVKVGHPLRSPDPADPGGSRGLLWRREEICQTNQPAKTIIVIVHKNHVKPSRV